MRSRLWLVFLVLACASAISWSQVDRGSITGIVADSTGAVVPGVQVTVTAIETGVSYHSDASNEQGVYRVLNLPIGKYTLVFARDGFKTYTRSGVSVAMSQNVTLNATLEVGNRVDSVTVTSDASMLDTEDALMASTATSAVLTDLPMTADNGRDIRNFGRLFVPTFSTVTGTQNGYNNSVAGSQIVSIATSIDGVSADSGLYGIVNGPSMDAVQQYQVQVAGISAAAAQSGGGEQMFELKSGTNTFHGSAYAVLANEDLNANTWSNNYYLSQCTAGDSTCRSDYSRSMNRYQDWGFSAGGPIWKKHTFIFGAYEHYHKMDLTASPRGATVPTTKMLSGDFSELLSAYTTNPLTGVACDSPCPTGQVDASGNPIYFGAIFNPASPGNVFDGNIIPSGSLSSESKAVAALYQKYYAPETSDLINNYWGYATFGSNPVNTNYHLDLKLDHNFSDRNHFNTSYNLYEERPYNPSGLWQHGTNDGGPLTESYLQGTRGWEIRLQDYYTISANLINFATVGYNYWLRWDVTTHPVDNTSLDFPSTGAGANNFPVISFGGNSKVTESQVGADKADHLPYYQAHYKDELSWVHGRHVAKFGGEFIAYGANSTQADGYLNYTFNSNTGESLAVNDGTLSPYVGFGFANFLLGEVGAASKTVGGHLHGRRKGLNFYAEDTIKWNSKLTVNASLRWDINTRWKEVNGHWTNFDLNAENTSWSPLEGAFEFLSNGSQSFEKNQDLHLFAPHIGASYQLTPKLVARGSYAMSYVPLGINQWGGAPFAGEASFGYTGTDIMPSASTPVDSIYQWDGGSTYPGNYVAATRNSNANTSCPWCTVSVDPDKLHLGHTHNWNLGVEYELAKNTIVDVNYIGNRGGHLHDGEDDPRNYPKWSDYEPVLERNCGSSSSYSSCANQWVSSESDAQLAGVTWYPFLATMTNGYGGYSASVAPRPYPQTFQGGVLFTDSAIGSSRYDALVTEVKRNAANGLSLDMSYTFSHEAGNVNRANGNFAENWGGSDPYQDPYAMDSLKNLISPNDVRHEVKGYASYTLPFGRGSRWLAGSNQVVNQIVSGWTLAGDLDYHAGQPIAAVRPSFSNYPNWANTFANLSKTPGALKNHFKHLNLNDLSAESNQFVSRSSFTDMYATDGSGKYLNTLGNQPAYFTDWRGFAYYNEDLSILKKFAFHDSRYRLTLRAEFFDVLNRHHWNAPDTYGLGDSYFGNVTGVSTDQTAKAYRYGQFGGRLEW